MHKDLKSEKNWYDKKIQKKKPTHLSDKVAKVISVL